MMKIEPSSCIFTRQSTSEVMVSQAPLRSSAEGLSSSFSAAVEDLVDCEGCGSWVTDEPVPSSVSCFSVYVLGRWKPPKHFPTLT